MKSDNEILNGIIEMTYSKTIYWHIIASPHFPSFVPLDKT